LMIFFRCPLFFLTMKAITHNTTKKEITIISVVKSGTDCDIYAILNFFNKEARNMPSKTN